MSDVAEFSPGEVLLGKLSVVRRLGAGGIGAVYEVEHQLTKHRRALKVLHPKFQADRELVERFLREASAAGRIGNPHIIECFDAGRLESGAPYILMELLMGEPLSDRLRHAGQLSAGEAVDLVLQCIEGLAAAHHAGIVHRDLKPDNLFIISQGGRDFLKVLDFGISKFDSALTGANAVTATGAAMGTPLYMPPEQMRGAKEVDQRADIYSLGIILYECLSGRVPYGGESFAELAAAVLASLPIRLESLRTDLPTGLTGAVHKAFSREPSDRYPSVEAFAEALMPFRGIGVSISRTVSGERDFGSTLVKATPVTPGAEPPTAPLSLDATAPSPTGSMPRAPVEPPLTPSGVEGPAAPSRFPRAAIGAIVFAVAAAIGVGVMSRSGPSTPLGVNGQPLAVLDAGHSTSLTVIDAGPSTPLGVNGQPTTPLAAIDGGPSTSLGVNGQPTAPLDAGPSLPDAGRKRPPVKPAGEIKSTDLEDTL